MKRLLLLAALTASVSTAWAQTPVTQLTDGGKYFIYDAHGDNGTTEEQTGGSTCRYAFRYDDVKVQGTHKKPANAEGQLELKHVWTAYWSNNDESWCFRNEQTKRWLYTNATTHETDAIRQKLTPVENSPGSFHVTSTYAPTSYWDGSDANNYEFCWWAATTDKHPYKFFAVDFKEDGTYAIAEPGAWTHTSVPLPVSHWADDPQWTAWFMHNSFEGRTDRYTMTYNEAEDVNVSGKRNARTDKHPDNELWAFVSTGHNRFKIYNKAAGMDMALTFNEEGATMESKEDATTWELVPSTAVLRENPSLDKQNPNKYFCLKPVGQTGKYANLQNQNGNWLLKSWNETDGGSTGWVEKKFQPVVDYYTNEVFDTNRPDEAVRGCVGDFATAEDAQQAETLANQAREKAASFNPNNITDEQMAELANFKTQFDAVARVTFDTSKTYRFYNKQYNDYMQLNAEGKLAGGASADDENTEVTFTSTGNGEGKYYLSIGTKYFANVVMSQQTTTTDNTSQEYTMTQYPPFLFVFKGGNHDKGYLHEDNQHRIVGWGNGSNATYWYLMPAGEVTTEISETVADAPADNAVYDLQGRRVAAPAPGNVYIVNRRKVFVK